MHRLCYLGHLYRAFHVLVSLVLVCSGTGSAQGGARPISIGASLSFEGKYVEPSEMMRIGYRMWVDRVNAHGGLLERPVKLILYDDQSDLAKVKTNYRTLLETDRVDLLLSPYGSPATMVASELSEAHGKVMIAAAASAEQVFTRGFRYLFGLYAPADRFCIGFIDLLARRGLNRIGILYEESPFHKSVYAGVQHWAQIFGVDIVYRSSFPQSDVDFGRMVSTLKSQSMDGLIYSSYPLEGYAFIEAVQKLGYKPPALLMTITSINPDFERKAGGFSEGVFGPSQWEPIESIPFPDAEQFVANFKRLTGHLPSYHASAAFSAGQILEHAVRSTRSLEHGRLRDHINRLNKITIIGRFKVDETGRQVGHDPMIIQWQKGRKEIVYPAKMKTAEPVFDR